jgi:hypothetical protein
MGRVAGEMGEESEPTWVHLLSIHLEDWEPHPARNTDPAPILTWPDLVATV